MVTQFNSRVFTGLNHTVAVAALHMLVPKEKVHVCLLETSVDVTGYKETSRAWTTYNARSTHASVMRSSMRDIASTCCTVMLRTTT